MEGSEIVVDTSAFVAIYRQEPWAQRGGLALARARSIIVPASCPVEAALLDRTGPGFFDWFQTFTSAPVFMIAEITRPVSDAAVAAARIYGKGSGHPAQLNFGDCLTYAVAKHRDLPLLFVGNDFSQTDITPALKSG